MTFAENIVSVYDRATPEDISEGMTWYEDAHAFARSLDTNVWRAAGVIAAMSPLKRWDLNMRLATNAYATGVATGHFTDQNVKAQSILDGAAPLDVLGGDKTIAFCAAIATCGRSLTTVIDRHAYDIALNAIHNDKTRNIGKRVYATLHEHYWQASLELGITNHELQAVTWVAWRREKGIS